MNTRWALKSMLFTVLVQCSCAPSPPAQEFLQPTTEAWKQIPHLPDLSGIEWISANNFLAVHDSKYPSQRSRPRVSIIQTKEGSEAITWTHLEVAWPKSSGPSSDLESIARIPGTNQYLLIESGNDGERFKRIFLSALDKENRITILEVINWPVEIYNVEATAVVQINKQNYFLFAERADGKNQTEIKWATLNVHPLRFGAFSSVVYTAGVKGRGIRPIVSLTADKSGNLYAAAAYDPGNEGPFRSYVSCIGKFGLKNGIAVFSPSGKFANISVNYGNKIEGITISEKNKSEIFAGTDDENLGASFKNLGSN